MTEDKDKILCGHHQSKVWHTSARAKQIPHRFSQMGPNVRLCVKDNSLNPNGLYRVSLYLIQKIMLCGKNIHQIRKLLWLMKVQAGQGLPVFSV